MVELHHPHDTKHAEGFNKLITKFLPKNWTYCKTIENKVRIYLTMCIQSVGYRRRLYGQLFPLTGIQTDTEFTPLYLHSKNLSKDLQKWYQQKKTNVKVSRM